MSVGAMKDQNLKLRNLHASHALGCTEVVLFFVFIFFFCAREKRKLVDGT